MNRRIVSLTLAFCLLSVCLVNAHEKSPLRIGVLKGPTGLGLIKVVERGDFIPAGLDLEVVVVPSVDLMLSYLSQNKFDFAALPPNTLAKIARSGMAYSMAAVIGQGMLSFITDDQSIKSPKDLRDTTILCSGQGAVPEYLFRAILSAHGLESPRDLKLDFALAYPETAMALISGRAHYAVLPEPFATMALSGNKALRVPFDLQALFGTVGGSPDYPISVLAISNKTWAGRREECQALLSLAERSITWVVANPEAAGALVERLDFGLKAGIASASIPKTRYCFIPAKAARKDMEALLSVLLKANPDSIGKALPSDDFYAF